MFIKQIINDKSDCFFISPHFDDAIYSCGGLISLLRKNNIKVTLINVFSSANEPSTLSAKKFLKVCGFNKAEKLFNERAKEDMEVCVGLKIKQVNLNFTDALWRKKEMSKLGKLLSRIVPEAYHVYPTYKFHIRKGVVSKKDNMLYKMIRNKINTIIPKNKKSVVFLPLAIGKHVDHTITRDSVKRPNEKVVYWADFPYVLHFSDQDNFIKKENLKTVSFIDFDSKSKERLIKMYKTQFKAIFSDGKINLVAEKYFIKNI